MYNLEDCFSDMFPSGDYIVPQIVSAYIDNQVGS